MGLKPKLFMAPEFGVTPTGYYPSSGCFKDSCGSDGCGGDVCSTADQCTIVIQ